MSCPSCAPALQACTTVYPTLNPCQCDSPGGIEETGPTGNTGPKGETPQYTVGTVASGAALITVRSTGYATRVVDFVLPAIPEGVGYVWTAVNTFSKTALFDQGIQITGGTTTIGGIALNVGCDTSFTGDMDVGGNLTVAGNLDIGGNFNESGSLTVQGDSIFHNVEFFEQTDLTNSTLDLPNVSTYPSGIAVLGSCLNMEKQPNRGGSTYIKAEGASLAVISPVDSGPICATIVVNVPVSACVPQVTPVVDIRIRVGYRFGNPGIFSNFNSSLWQTMIGGTQLDFYTQGDGTFNANAGFFELFARATLVAGNNNFIIEVTNNDTMEDFTPTDVTYWVQNN